MDKSELVQLIKYTSEDEHLEFKEASLSFNFDSLLGYCVALANEGGGRLILGVTNKYPRTILGTLAFRNLGKIREQIYNRIKMRVSTDQVLPDIGQRVVVFNIPSRPRGVALDLNGSYLMRSGESLVSMDFGTIQRIG